MRITDANKVTTNNSSWVFVVTPPDVVLVAAAVELGVFWLELSILNCSLRSSTDPEPISLNMIRA
jgi:hypothetical protein